MKKVVILSGKGGVGKSSIAASLAVLLARNRKLVAADCDVDAPNLGLVLGLKNTDFKSWKNIQTNEKAHFLEKRCTSCKKCLAVCNFNAINWDKSKNKPIFNKILCEGCGACSLVCKPKAIVLKKVNNAKIGVGKTKFGFHIVSGQLKMGESGSGKIVSVVKNKAYKIAKKEKAEIVLIDSAAGVGCPVIASITGADYGILVTEPTPSAFSDMERALKILRHFNISCGIVINKYTLNRKFSYLIEKFAYDNGIPILEKIPYNKDFVRALVNLTPIVIFNKKFENVFSQILIKTEKHLNLDRGVK